MAKAHIYLSQKKPQSVFYLTGQLHKYIRWLMKSVYGWLTPKYTLYNFKFITIAIYNVPKLEVCNSYNFRNIIFCLNFKEDFGGLDLIRRGAIRLRITLFTACNRKIAGTLAWMQALRSITPKFFNFIWLVAMLVTFFGNRKRRTYGN